MRRSDQPVPLVNGTFESRSAAETKRIGRALGRVLCAGDMVAVNGELGSGKTTFIQGVARGLDVPPKECVSSPSFALIHEYEGRLRVYHVDWYRLPRVSAFDAQIFGECLGSGGVTLVEWARRGKSQLPRERIEVLMEHAGQSGRKIRLVPKGRRFRMLLEGVSRP